MQRSHGLMNIGYCVDTVVIVQINGSGESIISDPHGLTPEDSELLRILLVLVLFPRILTLYLKGCP